MSVPLHVKLRNAMRKWGLVQDPGSWIDPARRVLLCARPRKTRDLASLQSRGIRHLVNVDDRPHPPGRLAEYGLTECFLRVKDFHAPTASQLTLAVSTIVAAVAADEGVAIHCAAGLGRSGTVAACYLIELGKDWQTAVAQVRAVRPGAIETRSQVAAIKAYADGEG